MSDIGSIAPGKWADLAVLDRDLQVSADLSRRGTRELVALTVYVPEVDMRLGTILLVATTLLPGCEVNLNHEGLTSRDVKTFKVTGQAELVLDTFDGAIELHSWDKNEIEVEIEKRAMEQVLLDEIKVDAQQQGDKITIKVTGPSRMEHRGITLRRQHFADRAAPRRGAAQHQHQRDQRRRLDSRRSDRRPDRPQHHRRQRHRHPHRRRHPDSLRRRLDSPRSTPPASSISKPPTAASALEAKPTVLRVRTGDGSIRANIEADTVMADSWDLTTSDGSVTVTLPGQFSAELDAETSDGTVRTNHPLLEDDRDRQERRDGEDRDDRRERRRVLKAKMGDGGKAFRIRTGDGTIRIER